MAATLPTVHGTGAALYPIPRGNLLPVNINKFLNGSEQRFVTGYSLCEFQLAYTGLFHGDRDALKAFYSTTKGSFSSAWSFTLGASVYPDLTFMDDTFISTEGVRPGLYDVSFKFRQTIPGGGVAGAGTSFPVLSTGAGCQRPYTQMVRQRTVSNDNPSGPKYAFAFYGAGLTGFPNGGVNRTAGTDVAVPGLFAWKLIYPSITDADMAALEAHFVAMSGSWKTFTFTDPDSGTVFNRVRYDQELIQYQYLQKNQATTTIMLAETN